MGNRFMHLDQHGLGLVTVNVDCGAHVRMPQRFRQHRDVVGDGQDGAGMQVAELVWSESVNAGLFPESREGAGESVGSTEVLRILTENVGGADVVDSDCLDVLLAALTETFGNVVGEGDDAVR